MSNNRKKRGILFIIELLLGGLLIVGLFIYGQINSSLTIISAPQETEELHFEEDEVVVNTEVKQIEELRGYKNIALFALDTRVKSGSEEGNNSDTIMVASINNDTKAIKLVSVYRDTLLNVGDDYYLKCNSAYALGGVQQAVSMLNSNLDLDITDYVTVDFRAMVAAVDLFDGLDIPMTYQELVHMNNYCVETAEETGADYEPIELPFPKPEDETKILDTYHLNGVQATSYCRIRYTANLDFGRTERQRLVLSMLVEKAKHASLSKLTGILDEVFPYVHTSLTKSEIMRLAMGALSYSLEATAGFPMELTMGDLAEKGSVVIPTTLESNVIQLHSFLFDDPDYNVSSAVKNMSEQIVAMTGCDSPNSVVDESLSGKFDFSDGMMNSYQTFDYTQQTLPQTDYLYQSGFGTDGLYNAF